MKKLLLPLVMSLMAITSQAQTYHLDTNNDGSIELTDALIVINYILGKFDPEDAPQPQSYLTCPDDHHPHLIDLGLPSGTKWACCNVDTDHPENHSPTNYGGQYAWGEIEVKDYYGEENYAFFERFDCEIFPVEDEDGEIWYDEYCWPVYSLNGEITGTEYDVAHVKWGGSWQIPTYEQMEELFNNCSYEWTTVNGVNGGKFTSSNGGSLFMPAAGCHWYNTYYGLGSGGYYWLSSNDWYNREYPGDFYFNENHFTNGNGNNHYGESVRPVFDKKTSVYHFDVNNDGSIELTDALIIINYILGKFVPEGEWYMVAKTSDSDTELVPVKEVGSLVAVDDALDFTILGINGDVILEKVLRVDFKPERDLNIPEPSLVRRQNNTIPREVRDRLTLVGVSGMIDIYDKDGVRQMSVASNGGATDIGIGHLPTGAYSAKVGKQTFKFVKK